MRFRYLAIVAAGVVCFSAHAGTLVESVERRLYVTVHQPTNELGEVMGTVNELIPYNVGYRVEMEQDQCWKTTTTETGERQVELKLKTSSGVVNYVERHPVLEVKKELVECSKFFLQLRPAASQI